MMPLAEQKTPYIRDAERRDEPFLREMAQQVFAEFGDYRQSLREWLREDTVVSRIIEEAGVPIGFYMMEVFPMPRPSRNSAPGRKGTMMGYLLAVGVTPSRQRQGIGVLLMKDALMQAQAHRPPVAEVRLSVAEGNMKARRLFNKVGFFDGGSDQRLYENGQQALIMRQEI
jgi:ribosomal protein S18 acetylase RimI-like enzyme